MAKGPLNKQYLQREYWNAGRTLRDIGAEKGVSAETVRAAILKCFGRTRTQSETLKLNLRTGRQQHPTQGRPRTPEEKLSIGAGVREGLTAEQREARRKRGREQWAALSEADKALFAIRGADGLNRARNHGSKFELGIAKGLRERGYDAIHRPKRYPGDVYVRGENAVLFIEGRLTLSGDIEPGAAEAAGEKRAVALKLGYKVVRVMSQTECPSPAEISGLLTEIVIVLELTKNQDHSSYHEVGDGAYEGGCAAEGGVVSDRGGGEPPG